MIIYSLAIHVYITLASYQTGSSANRNYCHLVGCGAIANTYCGVEDDLAIEVSRCLCKKEQPHGPAYARMRGSQVCVQR